MNKYKLSIALVGALFVSANAFAGNHVDPKEQVMRGKVVECINDIQKYANDLETLSVIYGDVHKTCSSHSDKARKLITPNYEQQEKWEAEFQELLPEYQALTKEDKQKPHAQALIKKIRVLTAPEKLGTRSKIHVYRAMMQEIDKLDGLLPSVEGY